MTPRTLAILVLLMPSPAVLANTLYKCTDEGGQVLYTNQKGGGKNCVVLSRDLPISTFAPPPRAKPNTPSPADFPKVSSDQQKARDGDRRAILDQELATEQKNADEARKVLAEQEGRIEPTERNVGGTINQPKVQERLKSYRDKLRLHERNIEALKKEIGNLK